MSCGGRLLDFTGPNFQNAESDSYLGVPRAVASRWSEIAVAERQIDDLKAMKLAIVARSEPIGAGGKAYKEVMSARAKELDRISSIIKDVQIAAKLIGSPDDLFSRYWDNYYWRKSEALSDPDIIRLPSGEQLTCYDLLINELRSTLKAAVRRIRNER